MAKNAPPKRAKKPPLAPAKPPRAKRPPKHAMGESERNERARKAKARQGATDKRKRVFTDKEIDAVCELIVEESMSLKAALKKMNFHRLTFRLRMRENPEMAKKVNAARQEMCDENLDPADLIQLTHGIKTKAQAAIVKVQLYGREMADKRLYPERHQKNVNLSGGLDVRVPGLGALLKEISDAGGDTGIGPSKGVASAG
jgi:hypothetical protein